VLDWGPEVLRDIAMATNFGTQFAITGCVNDCNEVIGYGGGLSGQPTKCNIVDNQQLMDAAMATIFWAFDGL